jgi:hypothetical protein
MKKSVLIFSTGMILLALAGFAQAQCPEDTVDSGICDTLYVEGYPEDLLVGQTGPHFVRFPIYVTHDVLNPNVDSLMGFIIPLCYFHTNASKYCSLSAWWNNTNLYPFPDIDRSVFRHLDADDNWMMALSERMDGSHWNFTYLDLDGTSHFWLGLVATGPEDQKFEEGSRVLLATMTFKLEDTTTICVDTCFWPPANILEFMRSDTKKYTPRPFLPVCETVAIGEYSMVINEVMFYPDTTDTAHLRNHEWVELFNYGNTANTGGWVISNRDATQDAVLPGWDFPESTYLVVHFTTGTNDNDFSDGEGDYYEGSADVFADSMDECALYAGSPSASTIIDFMNWSESFTYSPGQAYDHALSANIWTPDDYFTPVDTANIYAEIDWVTSGESMGRDSSSTDTDNSVDWATFGGADAIYSTPGAVNYQLLEVIGTKGERLKGHPADWTVMFYLNGDNNLEESYFRILDDMEKQGSLPNVNLVV